MDTTNNEVFENGYASGKIDGFKEGWELARRTLYDYSNDELRDIFGIIDHYDIFSFPTEDVRECFKEYKNRIRVGDVIKSGKYIGVVLQTNNPLVRALTRDSNGHAVVAVFPVGECVKIEESVDSFSDMLKNVGVGQ